MIFFSNGTVLVRIRKFVPSIPSSIEQASSLSIFFFTLYTTIPHQKLVLGHEETCFVKDHSNSKNKYSEDGIIKMLESQVDNIFVVFAGKVFPAVGIPMGTNFSSLLAVIFLYSYEVEFILSLLSTGKPVSISVHR